MLLGLAVQWCRQAPDTLVKKGRHYTYMASGGDRCHKKKKQGKWVESDGEVQF